jgi:hypothetical protein
MLRKAAPRCSFVKSNGERCKSYVLTREGVQRMLAGDFDLVADPERFCAYHARSESERYEMSVRGGSYSPKRAKAERQAAEEVRDAMPQEIKLAAYTLIRSLINAKLPTSPPEVDTHRVAVGVYLASAFYARPADATSFLHSLLPRELRGRDDLEQIAQTQLRSTIETLEPAEQSQAWELLATA